MALSIMSLAVLTTFAPVRAQASNYHNLNILGGPEGTALMITTTGTTAGLTVIGAISIYLNYLEVKEAEERRKRYILDNVHALTAAISLGAGEQVDDLAAIFGLGDDHRQRFGLLIRKHRALLLDLARVDVLTGARATNFFQTIGYIAEMARSAG